MKSLNESLPPIDLATLNIKRRASRGTTTQQEAKKENKKNNQNSLEGNPNSEVLQKTTYNNGVEAEVTNINISTPTSFPNMNEVDAMGPFQWLDDEIIKLSYMFESGVLVENEEDPNNCGGLVVGEEIMGNREENIKGDVWSSSSGEWNNTSCSSMNSVYDYNWPDMHLEGSSVQSYNQWDFCEDDQDVNCLWGNDNCQVNGFYQ